MVGDGGMGGALCTVLDVVAPWAHLACETALSLVLWRSLMSWSGTCNAVSSFATFSEVAQSNAC